MTQEQFTATDELFKSVLHTMERFDHGQAALLEVLHTAQEAYGHLSREVLIEVADRLDVPLSQIYSTATFYEMYSFEPDGKRHCMICTDPVCTIAGAEDVLAAAQQHTQTNPDTNVSVKRTTCLGLCDQAPAALVEGMAFVNLNAPQIDDLFTGKAKRSRLQVTGKPRILTHLIGKLPPTDLDAHRGEGAFAALTKALTTMSPEEVIEQVKISGLTGRGGAGFPTGLKWQFTRQAGGTTKYVICNFDESEPGTFKDRVLMEGDPFQVIEGMLLCGYAIGATHGYVFIRGEYPQATQVVQEAIDRLYDAGLLGKNILNTDFCFELMIRRGAGAYICGEETALFEAIEGRRGFPRLKPPFPTTHGVFGKPTAINNVETLAIIPHIVLEGGQWLRQWGTEKSVGCRLFCLSGHVKQPGVIEAPLGIPVRELIEQYGGGFDGTPQAILMGGASGGFLHPDNFDTPLTNEALGPLGAPIGSGVVMVINQTVGLLDVLKVIARFFVHESCGQCTPCRIGTVQISKLLDKLTGQNGTPEDLIRLEKLCEIVKKSSLCGLGQTAPNPVLSTLRYFREEYEALLSDGAVQEPAAS